MRRLCRWMTRRSSLVRLLSSFSFLDGERAHVMYVSTDARSWRFRCRVMAVISLFTYVPFIVCVAIFAGR